MRTRVGLFIAAVLVAAVAGPPAVMRAAEPTTQRAPLADAESGQLPQLRFLAWQEEEDAKARETPVTWRPHGERVKEEADQKILQRFEVSRQEHRDMYGNKVPWRILHLWFSHPDFDRSSSVEVKLTDASGKELPGAKAGQSSSTDMRNAVEYGSGSTDKSGWMRVTKSPGLASDDLPKSVNIELRYAVGPWKEIGTLNADFDGPEKLGESTANPPKEVVNTNHFNDDGTRKAIPRTAIRFTHAHAATEQAQFDVRVVTRDGRELAHASRNSRGNRQTGTEETYEFDAPLADIQSFKFRTRPIREMTFKDVSLQPGALTTPSVVTTQPASQPASK